MKKIASFTVNHLNLDSGVYVSREDCFGEEIITTFDLRITRPNKEPVMNTAEIHTIEHLGATFLRNHHKFSQEIVYFGPMGCRTGFYMVIHGKYSSLEILPLIKEMFDFIKNYEGDVPGASARDCGNYLDLNLNFAKFWATRYLETLNNITPQQLVYQP